MLSRAGRIGLMIRLLIFASPQLALFSRNRIRVARADQVGGLLLQIDLNGRLRVYGSNCTEHHRQFEDPPQKIGTYPRRKSFRLRDLVLRSTGRCACGSRQLAANRVINLRGFDSAVQSARGRMLQAGSPRRPRPTGACYTAIGALMDG
jgi:hypothetical protein